MASGKGDVFWQEAEKALNRTTIFGFGKSQKYEDAAEAFVKAGNAYKLANLWESAGKENYLPSSMPQKYYSSADSEQFMQEEHLVELLNAIKN